MKTIGIFTTSRAEYGLLSTLLDTIENDQYFEYLLFVGGSHHLDSQGRSIDEIEPRGSNIITFDFLLNTDTEKTLTQSMAVESFQLSELFEGYIFDYACVLGDRIELLPIVQTAIIFRKPIIHIHGGEVTSGAIDDQIRHMITKASHLHFCAAEAYKENIIKMGEEAWRVHNVGALGVDSISEEADFSREELFDQFRLDISNPTVLLPYHPVTLEFGFSHEEQIRNLFMALESFDFQVMITAPNIDTGHEKLFELIHSEVARKSDYIFIQSLGIKRYQSMLRCVEFVIGNSSSGILEVPFFKIPTVNIGDRQTGRIRHESVLDCTYLRESISKAIKIALDHEFKSSLEKMDYKFGDGHAAERIIHVLRSTQVDQKLMRKQLEFSYA